MTMSSQDRRHQIDVVWFPYAGSSLFAMSVQNDLRPRDARQLQWGHALGMVLRRAGAALRQALRTRAVRAQLMAMDEYMLDDIGLTRGDIEAVARGQFQPRGAAAVHELPAAADADSAPQTAAPAPRRAA